MPDDPPTIKGRPEYRDLSRAVMPLVEALRNADLQEVEQIVTRLRAARRKPGDPNSTVWLEVIAELTPRQAALVWRHLPDPLKSRGRPKGRGPIQSDEELFAEIDSLCTRDRRTLREFTRQILRERGVVFASSAAEKNRLDHILRLYRQRGK